MNSQFLSSLFSSTPTPTPTPIPTDILSSVSDSIPIHTNYTIEAATNNSYGTTTTTTYNARFFCLGNLLIQFNDRPSTTRALTSIINSLSFPIKYTTTPYSVVSNNYDSTVTFTASQITSTTTANVNFLSIGPRPALFYPVVPFLTTGSPEISVSDYAITFTFNTSGNIRFYKSGKITSYTAIGAGGAGADGRTGVAGIAGGGGGGGGGGNIVSSQSQVTCDTNSIITVTCGTSLNEGNTLSTIEPPNSNYTYTTALVGTTAPVVNNTLPGSGGNGANPSSPYGIGGSSSGSSGSAGRPVTWGQSALSGGGGGGAYNGGGGGAGGSYVTGALNAGSGGGGAGGKSNNTGTGGAGGTTTLLTVAGSGGKGGNSGPTTYGANGSPGGGGGGGGAGGAGGTAPETSGGLGGKGGSGRVIFVIDFS
jgi:hypothetical protein